jgi:hypothetical protein
VRLAAADGGTTLVFGGGVRGDGRLADLAPGSAEAAGRRLLTRFAERLAEGAAQEAAGTAGSQAQVSGTAPSHQPPDVPAESPPVSKEPPPVPTELSEEPPTVPDEAPAGPGEIVRGSEADVTPIAPPEPASAVPPESGTDGDEGDAAGRPPAAPSEAQSQPSPSPSGDQPPPETTGQPPFGTTGRSPSETEEERSLAADDTTDQPTRDGSGGSGGMQERESGGSGGSGGMQEVDGEPPAEAAHARRTMIGRSAEEVDHAPPRGRYAPVPAPASVTASATLRWAVPAAAVALASAVVIGRALRRRR